MVDETIKSEIVDGTTKSGIKFNIDPRVADDTRLLYYLRKLNSEDKEVQNDSLFEILGILFGGEEGVITFMNAVASVHDGICDSTNMISELSEILEAAKLKN